MLIYSLLLALILTLTGVVITCIFGYQRNRKARRGIAFGVAICITLGVACGIAGAALQTQTAQLQEEYNTLMLYYNTVDCSMNEYVRFDYYNRVLDFNERFNDFQTDSMTNIWLKNLYPKNWDININPIDFTLHGDDFIV